MAADPRIPAAHISFCAVYFRAHTRTAAGLRRVYFSGRTHALQLALACHTGGQPQRTVCYSAVCQQNGKQLLLQGRQQTLSRLQLIPPSAQALAGCCRRLVIWVTPGPPKNSIASIHMLLTALYRGITEAPQHLTIALQAVSTSASCAWTCVPLLTPSCVA
jgi:hypothetical protein